MPTLPRLAKFHGMYDGPPTCSRCRGSAPGLTWEKSGWWLERAHVIDRCYGGSDESHNLRPLCRWCHKDQPIFRPGDERQALVWFDPVPDGTWICARAIIRLRPEFFHE